MKSDGALGENQSKGGPLSLLTLQGHLGTQIRGAVLDNGQSQSRSSGRMALVRPIEPFKHPALDLLGDPDAGILHHHPGALAGVLHRHAHFTAGPVVYHCIVAEVIEEIASSMKSIAQIKESSGRLEGARNEVLQAVEHLSEISAENLDSTKSTYEQTEIVADTFKQVYNSADELKTIADKLVKSIEYFKM